MDRGRKRDANDQPVRSFLEHLATLTRNDIRYGRSDGRPCPTLT